MNDSTNRVQREWHHLRELAVSAGFWTVREPVELEDGCLEISIVINGRSIASAGPAIDRVEFSDKQEIRFSLARDFPASPPEIRIDSPVFHPNIAADGIVSLDELELTWVPEMQLDLVLERLWDTLRCRLIDSKNAIHIGAGQWYLCQSDQGRVVFPVDRRPLFGNPARCSNIVRYRKHGQPFRQVRDCDQIVIDESNTPPSPLSGESPIHFID